MVQETTSEAVDESTAPTRRKAKAKAKVKKAKGKVKKAKSTGEGRPRTGVGETIKGMLAKSPNKTNAEIAEMALKKHPDSSTNAACVAWYRSQGSKTKSKKK